MSSDILGKILDQKKREVQEAQKSVPERELREEALLHSKGIRSLLEALSRPGVSGANIIAEIKRASPSKGAIRADLDPRSLAMSYESGGAAAISVLTDRRFFKAEPDDLPSARAAVNLPVLRKDFLISPYQVYEAAAMGADAVLLIVRALSGESLRDLMDLCCELRLDALVEVHSRDELDKAKSAGARLIGINNRDLATFQTDIRTSISLARHMERDQVAVSESGIHHRDHIEELLQAGIWNFLIGESLVRAASPEVFLRDLLGQ